MIVSKIFRRSLSNYAALQSSSKNPFKRTWDIISQEIPVMFGLNKKLQVYPEHVDVVVIGGGFIGSAVAYWLKTKASHGLSVVVLEKDPTYAAVQRNLSIGTLTQHFSLPENISLSQDGAEFLRNVKENLGNIDIQYTPNGYLLLACEEYADKLEQNVTIQKELGIRNELLTPNEIKNRYPWINTDDIKLGCIGIESEGTFDSRALLNGFISKSEDMGAIYINAEVTGFELEKQRDVLMEGITPGSFQRINKVSYKTPDNEEHAIKFAVCVLAAGHDSGNIARHAQIGTGEGLLTIPLPIEKRECNVYTIEDTAKNTGLNVPIIMDTSGVCLRQGGLGGNMMCSPVPLLAPRENGLPENIFCENVIKPALFNRFPQSISNQIVKSNTECYAHCLYDSTGILGPHPYHNNLYIAAGFGSQGCQHASGIGRAISELIIDGHYVTIDFTRLGFDRILTDNPLIDFNIY